MDLPRYHLVLDLETMDTAANAAIVAIGAVLMDLEAEGSLALYHGTISFDAARNGGGTVSVDTMLWWLCRPELAAHYATPSPQHALSEQALLDDFDKWLTACARKYPIQLDRLLVWGNGSSFDCTILVSAFQRYGRSAPWKFWNERDMRTLKMLMNDFAPYAAPKNAHCADADAYQQASFIKEWLRLFKTVVPAPVTPTTTTTPL